MIEQIGAFQLFAGEYFVCLRLFVILNIGGDVITQYLEEELTLLDRVPQFGGNLNNSSGGERNDRNRTLDVRTHDTVGIDLQRLALVSGGDKSKAFRMIHLD